MGAYGVEDGKAGGVEVVPVGDVDEVKPVQCVELMGGGTAESGLLVGVLRNGGTVVGLDSD